jgi:hypothetical protein
MANLVKSSALALIAAAGLASPALADVQVVGEVDVDKDIVIDVNTVKDKDVTIEVDFDIDLTGAAKSDAIVNATVDDVDIGPEDGNTDNGTELTANTIGSVNENTGIVQFNQDAGQATNQGNVISAAIIFSEDPLDAQVVISEAYVDQRASDSSAVHLESGANLGGLINDDGTVNLDGEFEYDLTTRIADSYNGNVGVVMGNQNAGAGNNQHNVLSAAVGENALVALSDAGLGQETSGNFVEEVNTLKLALVADSVLGNEGIVAVNQSVGAFNNQATVISVAALSSAVGLGQ